MTRFITQVEFENIIAEEGDTAAHAAANRAWAKDMWNFVLDGKQLMSPTESFPTLTKVAAKNGWTFEA